MAYCVLGMTCHFIEDTYDRKSYVLGCQRVKGAHNYLNIMEVLTEIMDKFKIDVSKVTHIVTDNASNFGKSFKVFSSSSLPEIQQTSLQCTGNFHEEDDLSSCSSDNEMDSEDSDIEIVEMDSIFSNTKNIEKDNDKMCLPQNMRCCAHTLSLIATCDVSKITDANYVKVSKSTFNKLSSFWNLVSRSTVASDKVFENCRCKFPVPVVTRWNSLFDAAQKIISHKDKLVSTFGKLNLTKLKANEWVFLEEFCKIMQPLATSLDKLQSEKKSFLGFVAPTILVLRRLLIQSSTEVKYCKPLSIAIISGLEKRFHFIFDLTTPKSKDFIIASISNPKFKLNWVPVRYKDMCSKLFMDECKIFVLNQSNYNMSVNIDDGESDESDNDFSSSFNKLNPATSSNNSDISDTLDSSESRQLNLINLQVLTNFNSKKKELDLLDDFLNIKQIFLKYNTTLPSSAPVERLFSGAVQVFTKRRNRLNNHTFEMLLCCRSNNRY